MSVFTSYPRLTPPEARETNLIATFLSVCLFTRRRMILSMRLSLCLASRRGSGGRVQLSALSSSFTSRRKEITGGITDRHRPTTPSLCARPELMAGGRAGWVGLSGWLAVWLSGLLLDPCLHLAPSPSPQCCVCCSGQP